MINYVNIEENSYNLCKLYAYLCKYHRQTNINTDKHIESIVRKLTKNNLKKNIGLTLIEINVICEVPFYFVCICQKSYIISV